MKRLLYALIIGIAGCVTLSCTRGAADDARLNSIDAKLEKLLFDLNRFVGFLAKRLLYAARECPSGRN